MKPVVKARFLFSVALLLLLFSSPVRAYPTAPFDARRLLDKANVVCFGRTGTIEDYQIEADSNSSPPLETGGALCTVSVIGLIKGTVPAKIKVAFRKPSETVIYTPVVPGENALFFLKAEQDHFRFVDEHNGKLPVPPHPQLAYHSASPADCLKEELIYAAQHGSGRGQLLAVEQLGKFSSSQVVFYLKSLANSRDMALQGIAYASLIRLDSPPPATALAAFFGRKDDPQSIKRFRTTAYGNGDLKLRLLLEMAERFNLICRDFDSEYGNARSVALKKAALQGAQRWKGFDLIGFLKVAIANVPHVQNYSGADMVSYRSIAEIINDQIDTRGKPAGPSHTFRSGSRRIAAKLLSDPRLEVSEAAARTIDNMIVLEHSFPFPQGGRDDTVRYVKVCRDWIKQNPQWVNADE